MLSHNLSSKVIARAVSVYSRMMQSNNLAGGSGGSIRSASGGFGKLEAAREDEYFHKLKADQLNTLRKQLEREKNHHEHETKHHQDLVERTKKRIAEIEAGENKLLNAVEIEADEQNILLDNYKRSLAEIENIRKRSAKQIEESKSFAIQNFSKDLLEVADVLNLALKSFDEKSKQDPSIKTIYEGIDMTKTVLIKVFGKYGLVPTSPIGKKFDPNIHEAVMEIPTNQANCKPGHIADVVSIGYNLHDRPIRPPKVVVVKDS